MGSFFTPGLDYDLNTYLDNLGASIGESALDGLDTARNIVESGQFYFLGVPFPGRGNTTIAGRDTFTGNITVPPLSYLMSITGDSFYLPNVGPQGQAVGTRAAEGFQLRIYDKGGKIDTFLTTSFGNSSPSVGVMANLAAPNTQNNSPISPFYPPSPMVILAPGSLQLTVTNLSTVSCYIQILLQLAVPVNRQSANEMLIQGSIRK